MIMNRLRRKEKQQMKEVCEKLKPYLVILIFSVYVLFNGILLLFHAPWRDEANVWLMARDLSPLQLLREIKYQGHPCLWYFLVMPFAKLGLPFRTIGMISTIVMTVAAGIYLWKGPQWIGIKALVVFSPVFTYFYPTIARNYCLIALILILLAWNYSERNEHPVRYGILLGLLVQADTIAIAPAGMIAFVWLVENVYNRVHTGSMERLANCLKGIWIPFVSLLFWMVQFYQVSDSPMFEFQSLGGRELLREIRNYAYIILIRVTGFGQTMCTIFFVAVILAAAVVSYRLRNIGTAMVMLLSYLFQCVFSVMVYQLHIWHYLSLVFTFLWMMWAMQKTAEEKKREKDRIYRGAAGTLQVLLGILAVVMLLHWNSDAEPSNLQQALHGSYSDGQNAAEFIREEISPDEIILSTDVPMESTILAYLKNYRFYYAGSGKVTSYADWSEEQSQTISWNRIITWCKESFPQKDYIYLIQGSDSCITDPEKLEGQECIYETEGSTVRGEEYGIYRIGLKNEK